MEKRVSEKKIKFLLLTEYIVGVLSILLSVFFIQNEVVLLADVISIVAIYISLQSYKNYIALRISSKSELYFPIYAKRYIIHYRGKYEEVR